jgi:putative membrane protein
MMNWNGWFGMGWMWLWWLLIVVVVVLALRAVMGASSAGGSNAGPSAEEILKRRLASGEIDEERYRQLLGELRR